MRRRRHGACAHGAEADCWCARLRQVDTEKRLGLAGSKGDTLRVHPFFWGLSWDDLENRKVEPPHAAVTGERAATMIAKVHSAPHAPLRCVASTIALPAPHRLRNSLSQLDENSSEASNDAAASAMDKMFDFSEW